MIDDKKIIVALDYNNIDDALKFIVNIDSSLCRIKIGKELFTKYGPKIIIELHDKGFEVFLDLKFHDIPTTVYKACISALSLNVWMLNVHLSGGCDMAIAAMNNGINVGVEVPAALTVSDCWDLVNTSEKTGKLCMIMENVCYRRDVMAVLNMVRKDLFGEILHLQGGYQHDLRHVKFNNGKQPYGGGVEFGEKGFSESKWRTQHSIDKNADLYPTHGLGPVSPMIDINRGNRMTHLTSTSTQSRGLKKYIVDIGGKNHPNSKIDFKLGDIVTTVIKCEKGQTIVLSHDTNSPRPYSLNFRVQGTKGIWMKDNKSIYIEGASPQSHRWESDEKYMEEFDHPLWKRFSNAKEDLSQAGHGGMDFFIVRAFIEALKGAKPVIDVYDAVSMSVISPLSEKSIRLNSAAVKIPDFTRGRWKSNLQIFGLDDYI